MNRPMTILISVGAGFLLLAAGTAAGAATGGNFILGKSNSENTPASLTNTAGTPLKLVAPANNAPLKVSNSTQVLGLNAQYLGGMTAAQVATGGDGFNSAVTVIGSAPIAVASTGPLPAGTYYVTATALLRIADGDVAGFCYITPGAGLPTATAYGGAQVVGWGQTAVTTAVNVTEGDTLQYWCYTTADNGSVSFYAGITAIRVLSSSGTPPLRAAGHPITNPPGRPAPHVR